LHALIPTLAGSAWTQSRTRTVQQLKDRRREKAVKTVAFERYEQPSLLRRGQRLSSAERI
jgi:hypothetical protein